jgi:hypothetical protein
VTYNTKPTTEKEIPMKSFEETLFNAMLPMFQRALEAANASGTLPAADAPVMPTPALAPVSRSIEMPKAA